MTCQFYMQEDKISAIKCSVTSLTKQLLQLQSKVSELSEKCRIPSTLSSPAAKIHQSAASSSHQQARKNVMLPSASFSDELKNCTLMPNKSPPQANWKFNLIIFGVIEQARGTARHICSTTDMS